MFFISINFFANLLKIIEENDKQYEENLLKADFLLPDWIALKLFLKKLFKKNIYNLNGTDFTPYFIKNINNKQVILYWATENNIRKVFDKYQKKRNIIYFQQWYKSFERENLKSKLDKQSIKIMLIWTWTPRQEKRIQENIENIKKYNLIVFSVWWLFDFLSWEEKRAPKLIRKLNLERLWRAITKPKKNLKKTLNSLKLFKYLYLKNEYKYFSL